MEGVEGLGEGEPLSEFLKRADIVLEVHQLLS